VLRIAFSTLVLHVAFSTLVPPCRTQYTRLPCAQYRILEMALHALVHTTHNTLPPLSYAMHSSVSPTIHSSTSYTTHSSSPRTKIFSSHAAHESPRRHGKELALTSISMRAPATRVYIALLLARSIWSVPEMQRIWPWRDLLVAKRSNTAGKVF
jgi:hypothetical protein